jgi:hypothetical protein
MEHIFLLSVGDIQFVAKDKIGRDLNEDELEQVKKGVEWGLDCWEEVVKTAIDEIRQDY